MNDEEVDGANCTAAAAAEDAAVVAISGGTTPHA
jgi:6-phosphogluconolactonase/glucosamine-6-phosphate isomerase/deaminase